MVRRTLIACPQRVSFAHLNFSNIDERRDDDNDDGGYGGGGGY